MLGKERRKIIYRIVIVFLIVFASAMLQNGLGLFSLFFNGRVLFLIPVICVSGMCCGMGVGLAAGVFGGALWDLVSASPDGILALYLGLVGFISAFLVKNYMRNSLRTAMLFSFVSTVTFVMVKTFSYISSFDFSGMQALFFRFSLPLIFYTMLISPLIYFLLKKIYTYLLYLSNQSPNKFKGQI